MSTAALVYLILGNVCMALIIAGLVKRNVELSDENKRIRRL